MTNAERARRWIEDRDLGRATVESDVMSLAMQFDKVREAALQSVADDALEAADALAHAVRDMLTHDFSAGAVVNVENARKRYEALRPRNAPPLRPVGDGTRTSQVVTGTPYLVALFPVTCRCGADLHDLAACAAHECVRPLADETTETKGKP